MSLNTEMNGWYSIVVMIVAYLIVDIAFRIYFSGLLSRYGRDEIIGELYDVIFDDDKGVNSSITHITSVSKIFKIRSE